MKRHTHSLISLILLLSITSSSLYGQSLIQGQLINKDHQPLDEASIMLYQVQDSSFVTFALTKRDGSFHIPKVKPGLYYLQFKATGYVSSFTDPIRINPERTHVPMGVKILRRKKPKPLAIKPARA